MSPCSPCGRLLCLQQSPPFSLFRKLISSRRTPAARELSNRNSIKANKSKPAKESKKKSKDDKKKDKRKSAIRLKPKRKAVRKAVIVDSSDENSDSDAPVAKHSKKASVSFTDYIQSSHPNLSEITVKLIV